LADPESPAEESDTKHHDEPDDEPGPELPAMTPHCLFIIAP
jgi:hypothetical protein